MQVNTVFWPSRLWRKCAFTKTVSLTATGIQSCNSLCKLIPWKKIMRNLLSKCWISFRATSWQSHLKTDTTTFLTHDTVWWWSSTDNNLVCRFLNSNAWIYFIWKHFKNYVFHCNVVNTFVQFFINLKNRVAMCWKSESSCKTSY